MTGIDWLIIAFAALLGVWGYRQGLIVGLLSLAGFLLGAFLGSRLGPALLADGSESPYAPATALAGALLIGGIAAVSLEGVAQVAPQADPGAARRRRSVALADAAGGAVLLVAVALAIAWLFGAVALNAPGAKDLRKAVQRSEILASLNDAFPPSGGLLNALNRIDPGVAIRGPDVNLGPPDSKLAADPEVRAAADSVVRVLGTACGLGVSGSGWIAAPGVVVTNAHVVAGEEDTAVSSTTTTTASTPPRSTTTPPTTSRSCAWTASGARRCRFDASVERGPRRDPRLPRERPLHDRARAGRPDGDRDQRGLLRARSGPPLAHLLARRGPQRQLGRPARGRRRRRDDDRVRVHHRGQARRLRHPQRDRLGGAEPIGGQGRGRAPAPASDGSLPNPASYDW